MGLYRVFYLKLRMQLFPKLWFVLKNISNGTYPVLGRRAVSYGDHKPSLGGHASEISR